MNKSRLGVAFLVLMTFACLPPMAAAQYRSDDAGQYVIQGAQYGTSRNHVDVTNRLKELARADRIFMMGNRTFGVDPDPGQVKTLRIFARDLNGRDRVFDFREGQQVDGTMFRGWNTGQWGNGWNGGWELNQNSGNRDDGQYEILSAQYGTSSHHVDVTDRLKEFARHDQVVIMGNNLVGVDPDFGKVKTLRIFARGPDGRERTFDYREGSQIDGSQFRGWNSGNWGHGGWSGNWEGSGNNNGGGYGNQDRDSGQYVILNAQYGTSRHSVDVTDRLKQLARRDLTFRMGNDTFGVDPDQFKVKTLRIVTRGPDGREKVFKYREGSIVDGSQFKGWQRGDWGR
jgi:cell fate (sporulation/competence/biofilm development) regulator YlbF (YheA/YmcA/DUF963 family)